jgi:4-amino-4-deoxy-L-arabinose transferase-like glycosyltransferase
MSGFFAVKLVSALFFAATIFPLYGIFRRTFNQNTAVIGCLLLIFCSHLLRLASSGLRDSGKGFAMLLAVYALIVIYQQRKKMYGYFTLGAACAVMILIRDDCVLYAFCFLITALGFEIARRSWPWRSVVAGILMILMISPLLINNYRLLGYPVPSTRFSVIAAKIIPKNIFHQKNVVNTATITLGNNITNQHPVNGIQNEVCADEPTEMIATPQNLKVILDFLGGIFKGFYPFFLLLAIPAIGYRIYSRQWRGEENILLIVLLGHAFLVVMQILIFDRYLYVSRRYLLPISPLEFGWGALTIIAVYQWLKARLGQPKFKWLAISTATVTGCLLYLDAFMPTIKEYTSAKHSAERRALWELAKVIRLDYSGPKCFAEFQLNSNEYRSNLRPLVFCESLPALGYIAGGEASSDATLHNTKNDYWVQCLPYGQQQQQQEIKNVQLLKTVEFGKKKYILYKRFNSQPE